MTFYSDSNDPTIPIEEMDGLIDDQDPMDEKRTDIVLIVLLSIIGVTTISILLGLMRYWMVAGYGP
jgi:hypothetical protein